MEPAGDPGFAARLFGARPEHTLALLRTAWPDAVGQELARRTEVVALDRGVLRVKVPDLRWQRQLVRMRADILSRLRRVAAGAAPRALGFVVGQVEERPGTQAAPAEAPPAPAPASVANAAAAIPDPELRARFLAAAARYLGRFAPAQEAGGCGSPPISRSGTSSGSEAP
jgi:hypothetical protein